MGSRAAAILLTLLLAGCIGGSSDPTPAASVESAGELTSAVLPDEPIETPALAAPVWNVGDAWSATSEGGGEPRSFTLVVTQAGSDHYVLETTDQDIAGYDAIADISWLGRIRVADLAGEQQGAPVQFYSFPLEDGKTWTTTWDGRQVALVATKSARGFDIKGSVDGEPYVEYDYVSDLRWWSRVSFAHEGYKMTLQRVQEGWSGTVATATAKLLFEAAPAGPAASPGSGAFTVDEGQTYALLSLVGGGSQWARAFQLFEPGGTAYMSSSIENVEAEAAGPRRVFLQERLPPTPGEWHLVAPAVHDAAGGFHVRVHQVAITEKAFPAGG